MLRHMSSPTIASQSRPFDDQPHKQPPPPASSSRPPPSVAVVDSATNGRRWQNSSGVGTGRAAISSHSRKAFFSCPDGRSPTAVSARNSELGPEPSWPGQTPHQKVSSIILIWGKFGPTSSFHFPYGEVYGTDRVLTMSDGYDCVAAILYDFD